MAKVKYKFRKKSKKREAAEALISVAGWRPTRCTLRKTLRHRSVDKAGVAGLITQVGWG
jgi:hypothetical protein